MPKKGSTKESQTRSEDDRIAARIEAHLRAVIHITEIVRKTSAVKGKKATIADAKALMMIRDVLSELKEGGAGDE